MIDGRLLGTSMDPLKGVILRLQVIHIEIKRF